MSKVVIRIERECSRNAKNEVYFFKLPAAGEKNGVLYPKQYLRIPPLKCPKYFLRGGVLLTGIPLIWILPLQIHIYPYRFLAIDTFWGRGIYGFYPYKSILYPSIYTPRPPKHPYIPLHIYP